MSKHTPRYVYMSDKSRPYAKNIGMQQRIVPQAKIY